MKFKPGDKVRFLNEKGEGIVNRIINTTSVEVTIDDFEIPCLVSDLILIQDETSREITSKAENQQVIQTILEPIIHSDNNIKEGIYIALSPDKPNDIENSNMNVWFINHSPYQTLFTFSLLKSQKLITLEAGSTKAYESILIETIAKKQIESLSNFKIDVLFFDEKEHPYQYPVSEIKKLKVVKLYKENAFEENDFIAEDAYMIPISYLSEFENEKNISFPISDLSKLLFQKKTITETAKMSKPHNFGNEMEIDIHIEELLEDYNHLSNSEIIKVQLKCFQNALDTAITEHYRKLIVIHGVGKLRLKQEVRNLLSAYDNVQVYDASYAKYGFGATEIIIS